MRDSAQAVIEAIRSQPLIVGMVGAALSGTFFYLLRAAPKALWEILKDQFSVTLAIEGGDEIYDHLNLWFARNGAAKRVRRLMLQSAYSYDTAEWRWEITVGRGHHMVWFNRRPIFVHREVMEGGELAKVLGSGRTQRLSLTTLGRSQAPIRALIGEAERIYNCDGRVRVYFWHSGYYVLADRREPRALETVYMPAEQKRRIVEDAKRFIVSKAEYSGRGTPHRRGYLFEGPPGTGKTTMIFAVAGAIGRSVYTINLSNITGDNDLVAAFNEVGNDGVVVIEDIDSATITRDRAEQERERVVSLKAGAPIGAIAQQRATGITLSGLLNAIDGIAAREGRILFITSNHPDQLDPALLRPGRVDMREVIGPLDQDSAWSMFRAFRPMGTEEQFRSEVAPHLPAPAAEIQNLLQVGDIHA